MKDRDRKSWNSRLRPVSLRKRDAPKKKPLPLSEVRRRFDIGVAAALGDAPTRSDAMKLADSSFSKYIRLRDARKDGWLDCFICHEPLHWTEAHMMHFMSRSSSSTRFDEMQHAGCATCNGKPLGDRSAYASRIDAKYGDGMAHKLYCKSKRTVHLSTGDLLTVADRYSAMVEEERINNPEKFR